MAAYGPHMPPIWPHMTPYGDECEFRRVQCGPKWVVEQLVNGRREQLSVAVLSWDAKTRELTDGPGIRVVGKRGVLVHPEPLIL